MSGSIPYENALSDPAKKCLQVLTWLHVFIGSFFIGLAVYASYHIIGHGHNLVDFGAYYTGGHMARFTPSELYSHQSYMDFYRGITGSTVDNYQKTFFVYTSSPSFAVLLMPLSWFSYKHALLILAAINILWCLVIAKQSGKLADDIGLSDVKIFLQTSVFGLFLVNDIFFKGQMSLLYCACFMQFLWSVHHNKMVATGLWLAVLMQVRPQLFLPLFLYAAGCRKWDAVAYCIIFSLLSITVSILFMGSPVWIDYVHFIASWSNTADGLQRYISLQTNILGVLTEWLGNNPIVFKTINILYVFFCLFCLLWPWLMRRKLDMFSLALLAPFAFLVSVYTHTHDMVILLPVVIIMAALMRVQGQMRWMLLCYIPVSYAVYLYSHEWDCRIAMLIICVIDFYLLAKKSLCQQPETPTKALT